jgi:hypothetical protein
LGADADGARLARYTGGSDVNVVDAGREIYTGAVPNRDVAVASRVGSERETTRGRVVAATRV